jgi:ABC-type cobalamin/Fe3+-siderophores transport system ATPase subunit
VVLNYVKRVVSNIKGQAVDRTLGPKTLLVGPNGSGKSAIINSIEYGLHGFMSDYNGRNTVASKNYLSDFSDVDAGPLDTRLTIHCEEHDYVVTKPDKKHYPDAFPLLDLKEAIAGSSIITWEYLLRRFSDYKGNLAEKRARVNQLKTQVNRLEIIEDYLSTLRADIHLKDVRKDLEIARLSVAAAKTAVEDHEKHIQSAIWANNLIYGMIGAAMAKWVPAWVRGWQITSKEQFSFGRALSGGEYTAVITALAIACAEAQPIKGDVAIVIPDDRAMHPDNFRQWMETLANAPVQIILTSQEVPSKPVHGWTLVDVNHQ